MRWDNIEDCRKLREILMKMKFSCSLRCFFRFFLRCSSMLRLWLLMWISMSNFHWPEHEIMIMSSMCSKFFTFSFMLQIHLNLKMSQDAEKPPANNPSWDPREHKNEGEPVFCGSSRERRSSISSCGWKRWTFAFVWLHKSVIRSSSMKVTKIESTFGWGGFRSCRINHRSARTSETRCSHLLRLDWWILAGRRSEPWQTVGGRNE